VNATSEPEGAGDVIDVSGATVSTRTLRDVEDETLPAASEARTV